METEALMTDRQGSPRRPQLLLDKCDVSSTATSNELPSRGTSRPVPLPLYVQEPSTRKDEYRPRFISWRKIGLCIVVFPWSLVAGVWYVGRLLYKEASDQPVTVMGLTGIGILSVGIFLTALVLCIGKRLDRMARTRRLRMLLGSRIAAFSPRVMAPQGFSASTSNNASSGASAHVNGNSSDYSRIPQV